MHKVEFNPDLNLWSDAEWDEVYILQDLIHDLVEVVLKTKSEISYQQAADFILKDG